MQTIRRHRAAGRALLAVLILAALCIGAAACGSDSSESSSSSGGSGSGGKDPMKMTVTLLDTSNPWTASMGESMKKEAQNLGVDLNVVNGKLDAATQIAQIQQAIAQKDDAIIVNAVDPDALVGAINQASGQGIPVIAVNAAVSDKAKVVSFIGADNLTYGKNAADLAIKALDGQGKVAIIQGVIGNSIEALRTKGIEETLKGAPGIQVVDKVTDEWNNAKNVAAVRNLLNKYPKGELDAIIAEGPELYVGANAAHKLGRTDVKFIAGDLPVQVKKSIEAGTMHGTVQQDPATQGIAALRAAVNYVNGEKDKVKPVEHVELPTVTKDNVAQFQTDWSW